jgi:hypothetical protein
VTSESRTIAAAGAQCGSCQFEHLWGASTSVVFTGKSNTWYAVTWYAVTWYAVTWYAVTGPTQGNANVVLDGVLKVTVNNYATTLHDGVTHVHSAATSGNHALRIVMIGVQGASAATDTLEASRCLGTPCRTEHRQG